MRERPDKVFCGEPPKLLDTKNPRMLLVFNTTGTGQPGTGFKASFEFVTGRFTWWILLCTVDRLSLLYDIGLSVINVVGGYYFYPDVSSIKLSYLGATSRKLLGCKLAPKLVNLY